MCVEVLIMAVYVFVCVRFVLSVKSGVISKKYFMKCIIILEYVCSMN